MLETAIPPVATASIVIDLIGDLDARLGDLAANALRRLDPGRRVIVSLRHLTTVHSDGFSALAAAVKVHVSFGRAISIVSNGPKTQALLKEAKLGGLVVSRHAADEEPTVRRLLLARHAK
jgi:anti-anti-sigma regulatory factor